jgi:hypothetical protein
MVNFLLFCSSKFSLFYWLNLDEIVSEIFHGEAICDRKSTFQGHLAPIKNRKQVH